MFDQIFDSFRKASESTLRIQQDVFKNWTQQVLTIPSTFATGNPSEWSTALQRRWADQAIDLLNKHREALDSAYKSGISVIEQTFRVSDAKNPDDYRRTIEELWRQLFDAFKNQSETQFREFQKWADDSFDIAQKTSKV